MDSTTTSLDLIVRPGAAPPVVVRVAPSPVTADAFMTFIVLWDVATLLHLASFPEALTNAVGWALAGCACLSLLRPAYLSLFAAALALDVVKVALQSPFVANHILFAAFVDMTMLAALARGARYGRQEELQKTAVFREFAPVVRLELLVLYFFAVFHKLNADFFRPDVSCASELLTGLSERLPFLPTGPWVRSIGIYVTLLVESAIPVLLCLPRGRVYGVLLGVGFHGFLSVHPHLGIYSFTGMLFALFFLFVPEEVTGEMKESWKRTPVRPWLVWLRTSLKPRPTLRFAAALVVTAALAGALIWFGRAASLDALRSFRSRLVNLGLYAWFLFAAFVVWHYVRVLRDRDDLREAPTAALLWPPFAPLLALPALLVFNCVNPYLGLKTQTSLAMFSNLRTEGEHPNHFLVPRGVRVASYQDDLVEILDSSDARLQDLAEQHLSLPYFELRRRLSGIPRDVRIKYRRGGETVSVMKSQNPGHEVFQAPPWLQRKLLYFRPVNAEGPQRCRH